jgi:diphthamide biosynthesis protein 2
MTHSELAVAPALSHEPVYEQVKAPILRQDDSNQSNRDLTLIYETERTTSWIKSNGYGRIALQFPDELLGDSTRIVQILQDGLKQSSHCSRTTEEAISALDISSNIKKDQERKIYILADTSYGSCCVDEVAAEHADADCIVHYGRACLSP